MNMYDTEVAEGLLQTSGFEILRPEQGNIKMSRADFAPAGADVVLLNTCSVREGAEDKVYGHINMFGKAKELNPNLIIGLMGCMVEEHRDKLFKRFPQLDLMVGTRNIKELPALVNDVYANRRQVSRIKQDGLSIEYTDQIMRRGTLHAWLPIMTGCNKVCTFCIVPITRGSEVSMPARDVYREASRLVAEGVKWITLLGQNVNSYDYEGNAETGVKRESDFPKLLDELCKIEGLERISFTTSHPQDATEELYQVIAKNPKISRRFHLPLQSGSSRILKRMKRLHTFEQYLEKIKRMREVIPDISVTSDIITGFPGETEEDHQETVRALQQLKFDVTYIYKYSVRPGTPAAKLQDDVPGEVKDRRNSELLNLHRKIGEENSRVLIGKTLEVFVESGSPKSSEELKGRSYQEKPVIFSGSRDLLGKFVQIEIRDLKSETLLGVLK